MVTSNANQIVVYNVLGLPVDNMSRTPKAIENV